MRHSRCLSAIPQSRHDPWTLSDVRNLQGYAVFHLFPVPEMGAPQKSAMYEHYSEYCYSQSEPLVGFS